MVTLANVRGSDLVSNLGDIFKQGITEVQGRRREEVRLSTLEQGVQGELNRQAGVDSGLLGQLSPQMAQATAQARTDPRASAQLRDQTEQGIALATELQALPDHGSRIRRLRQEGGRLAASGGSLDRVIELSNLDPGQLDLQLQKMQLIGTETLRQLPISPIASVLARNPQLGTALLGRGDRLAREEQARRERAAAAARAARAPKTELGRTRAAIEADIASGAIDADRGAQMLELARSAATAGEAFDPQSPEGKLINDEFNAAEIFGADSPQAQAFADLREAGDADEPPSLTEVAGVRKEFTRLSGDFVTMRNAVNKVNAAIDSGAGDISLVFNYMKILDPNSVVRESEFATAENTAGIPERIWRTYNRALTGERLSQSQRDEFVSAANILFDTQLVSQERLQSEFTGIAERANINPKDVIVDFIGSPAEVAPDVTSTAPAQQPAAQTAPTQSAAVPQVALQDQIFIDTANRNQLTPQELWDNLSPAGRTAFSGEGE